MTWCRNKVTAEVASSDEVVLEWGGWCHKKRHRHMGVGGIFCLVTTKAETGAMWPQAKGCLEPPGIERGRLGARQLQSCY